MRRGGSSGQVCEKRNTSTHPIVGGTIRLAFDDVEGRRGLAGQVEVEDRKFFAEHQKNYLLARFSVPPDRQQRRLFFTRNTEVYDHHVRLARRLGLNP